MHSAKRFFAGLGVSATHSPASFPDGLSRRSDPLARRMPRVGPGGILEDRFSNAMPRAPTASDIARRYPSPTGEPRPTSAPTPALGRSPSYLSMVTAKGMGGASPTGDGSAQDRPLSQLNIPTLTFPTPRSRKIVSARYASVQPKLYQPSWRQLQDSARKGVGDSARSVGTVGGPGSTRSLACGPVGGGGSSVAANVAAGRNGRLKQRYQPTVEDISRALRDRPYLVAQICAIRDDPTLDKAGRMSQIGKVVQECEAPVAVSDLDRVQANFAPSRERMNGRRAAHSVYSKEAKAALAKAGTGIADLEPGAVWREHGGDELGQMLQYLDLVDARYLLALHDHGGNLPCWGALPDTARINRANMWRLFGWEARGCLGVLVVSYPWLDYDHPDPEGEILARLVPVLRTMLPLCGGDAYTVGVLIDYASLPQPTRTHAELTKFRLGLRALPMWLAHPYVPVLLVSGALPSGAEYKNTRKVEERGWCDFERRVASLSKSAPCLWEASKIHPSQLAEQPDERRRFDLMRSQMITRSHPPLAPASFSMMLQKKTKDGRLSFSNKNDAKLALDLYHAGFVKIFEVYQRCDPGGVLNAYAGHGWEEEEARQLAAALEYAAQKCKLQQTSRPIVVNLEGNAFGKVGERLIENAVRFGKIFAGVRF